MILVM